MSPATCTSCCSELHDTGYTHTLQGYQRYGTERENTKYYRDKIRAQADIEVAEAETLYQLKGRKRAEAQARELEVSNVFALVRNLQQHP